MADLEFMHTHAPEETTPQGTQENGVDNEHEGSDINVGSVIRWFSALAISTAIVYVVLWGVFAYWTRQDPAALPSPVFGASQVPPPGAPRLWPDPSAGGGNPTQPLLTPQEIREDLQRKEEEGLRNAHLVDANGDPTLPPAAVSQAAPGAAGAAGASAAPTSASRGLLQPMPSLSSGGTALQNDLR